MSQGEDGSLRARTAPRRLFFLFSGREGEFFSCSILKKQDLKFKKKCRSLLTHRSASISLSTADLSVTKECTCVSSKRGGQKETGEGGEEGGGAAEAAEAEAAEAAEAEAAEAAGGAGAGGGHTPAVSSCQLCRRSIRAASPSPGVSRSVSESPSSGGRGGKTGGRVRWRRRALSS